MEKKAVRATRKTRQLTTGHEVLLLFVAIFFIYNVNGRAIGCLDTAPASLLPFSILENHDLYLDQFHGYIERTLTYWVQEIDGHYLSSYPIVIPVLLTPLYVLPFLFIKAAHIPLDMSHYGFAMMVSMMEKLSASLIASFSVIFVFLAAKELVNRRTAVAVSLVFALATSTWTISGQGLWQHGLVELLLAMSVYLVLLNERQASNRIIAALGLVSGLLLFNRPVDGILLIPTICYILALKDRRIVSYLFALFISGAPFLYYNLHYFGNLFGGYAAQMTLFDFGPDMFTRFLGLLISPSRGLFIYTPVLLFSIVGFSRVFEIKNRNVRNYLLISGISVLSLVAVYATFEIWWAGWSYGPRFLTGTLPVLVMFLGLYLREIELDARRAKKLLMGGLFAVSLAWSVFAQFVGAFYYPNGGWNADLEEKLWDWKDTQIWRSFDAGMMPSRNYLREISKTVNLGPGTAAEQKPAEGWDETGLGRGESVPSCQSQCRNIRFGSRYLLLATGFDTTGKNPVLRLTWEGLDNSHPHYDGYVHILDGNGTLLENIAFHRRTPGTAPETLEAWWCDDVVLPQNAFRETVDAIALCLRERDGNLLESDGCGTDWGGKRVYLWTRQGRPLPLFSTGVTLVNAGDVGGILAGERLAEHVSFGDRYLLVGASVTADPDGFRLDLVWQNLKHQALDQVVFVHILDGEGKMTANADYPQSRNGCAGHDGMAWHDVVPLSREKLAGAKTLGIGLYRPPDSFLRIEGGKTDWNGKRLLLKWPAS